jgi:hypothetical protein
MLNFMILAFTYIVEEPQDDYSKKNHKRNQDGGEDSLKRKKITVVGMRLISVCMKR